MSSATLRHSTQALTPAELSREPHAVAASWPEVLALLASPDSGQRLSVDSERAELVDEQGNRYPHRPWGPLLVPAALQPYFSDRLAIPPQAVTNSFMQYFHISAIKQSGEAGATNAPSDDTHYQRHLFRMREFLQSASGVVLDVGCDDPYIGAGLLPPSARYIGLDPFCQQQDKFRVIGFGEYLPFQDATFDGVVFNTTLDHMLDWHQALDEAARILSPGGMLYISTLVWTARATLIPDSVHFHHFRDYEILGALPDFKVTQEWRYDYKGDVHRHGLFLALKKPLAASGDT
jgi:SAM-dependent methyltransferase